MNYSLADQSRTRVSTSNRPVFACVCITYFYFHTDTVSLSLCNCARGWGDVCARARACAAPCPLQLTLNIDLERVDGRRPSVRARAADLTQISCSIAVMRKYSGHRKGPKPPIGITIMGESGTPDCSARIIL